MKNKIEKGFTLIELIVSLAVLGIILVVFINLFSSALIWIYGSGDKGEAIANAQTDVENRIASGEAFATSNLAINFGVQTLNVPGGLVETNQSVLNQESNLKYFVPLVPTVRITPTVVAEGEKLAYTISVVGTHTHFSSLVTKVELWNKEGDTKLYDFNSTVTDLKNMTFSINNHLINAQGDYIVRIITPISGSPTEIVREKLILDHPNIVAAGVNSMFVSSNGAYWLERSAMSDFPTLQNINGVAYGNSTYVAVGDSGAMLYSKFQEVWKSINLGSLNNFSDITWFSLNHKFYAVGENAGAGIIYTSEDALNWTKVYGDSTTPEIKSVHATIDNQLIIVGENGFFASSVDGSSWTVLTTPPWGTVQLNDVTTEYVSATNATRGIIVVGNANTIYRYDIAGAIWTNQLTSANPRNFNAVLYENGVTVAVASDGKIYNFDGVSWTEQSVSGVTASLNDVSFFDNKFYIVGNDFTILQSLTGVVWSQYGSAVTSEHLNTIFGR